MGEYFLLRSLSLVEAGREKGKERVYALEFARIAELLEFVPTDSSPITPGLQVALVSIQHSSAHKARNVASNILSICLLPLSSGKFY